MQRPRFGFSERSTSCSVEVCFIAERSMAVVLVLFVLHFHRRRANYAHTHVYTMRKKHIYNKVTLI